MRTVKQEVVQNLEHAREVINNLQRRYDCEHHELQRARAIIYQLLYGDKPEPKESELKARVVQLEQDLQECIDKRQKLKELLREVSSNKL